MSVTGDIFFYGIGRVLGEFFFGNFLRHRRFLLLFYESTT